MKQELLNSLNLLKAYIQDDLDNVKSNSMSPYDYNHIEYIKWCYENNLTP